MSAINLYYFTVLPELKSVLETLMREPMLNHFRLVGGTSLSLQLGHRMSDDIDMFSDIGYDKIDFKKIERYVYKQFPFVVNESVEGPGFGKMYKVGDNKEKSVKIDFMHTDDFIREEIVSEEIRLATLEEITAMKMEILPRGGRMKDFWDLHELSDHFTFKEMIALHKERYPHSHDAKELKKGFVNFTRAEIDFTPVCLRGKHWETIKLDLIEFAAK